ncbi:aegerolysin family protein [Aliivibrio fischeri]|uniref:aegerolysin family protein n=1 Tax=Aliivibrio fischeri TaxID=668 RepID=UPI003F775EC2
MIVVGSPIISNNVNRYNIIHRDIIGSISNDTNSTLFLKEAKLKHGKWRENGQPDKQVLVDDTATFNAGKQTGASYGVTGQIEYSAENTAKYTLTFNNPYSGDNSASLKCEFKGETYTLNEFVRYNKTDQPMNLTVKLVLSNSLFQ